MPIFLCYDPKKRSTPWTQIKYQSMVNEFVKQRIKHFSISSVEELEENLKAHPDETSSIVFFPGSESERKYLFDRYKKFNIHRIVFSHNDVDAAACNFSYVMSDFYGDMELAISHLREKGCKRISLFCPNLGSYHDRMRVDTYKSFVGDSALIFPTTDKVYPALESLLKCKERIDAIICINDFVAFCLMLVLNALDKNWHEKLLILSFSNSNLSGVCYPSLSSISLNYKDGGREIATIHKALVKNNRMAYMRIVMKSQLFARETTEKEKPSGMVFSSYPAYDYEALKTIVAPQLKCMALEKLLENSDSTDLAIMHQLCLGSTIDKIALNLSYSRETVKYRIGKLRKILKFPTTAELSEWLRIWIDPNKLEKMI
ncbi:MAG: LacI family DNA-binding transcriptional regulator [Clostridia bacterium]|nr:LacI family DNA-binding transcriptional regulator [Clostridia bacterium]